MYPEADCEKTQAPPDTYNAERELRDFRLKQRSTDECAGQIGRAPQRLLSDSQILTELFRYHPPTAVNLPKFAAINQAAKNFAEVLLQNLPPCADRSAAIRLIRDARMTANAAVALDGLSL